MTAVQRWTSRAGIVVPAPNGECVKFSDVEEALKDSAMLEWLMPVIGTGKEEQAAVRKTRLAFGAYSLNLTGRELVSWAMAAEAAA